MVAVFAVLELRAAAPSPRVILVVEVAFAVRRGSITKAVGAFFFAIKTKPLATIIAIAPGVTPGVRIAANLTAVREVLLSLPRGPSSKVGEGRVTARGFILLIVRLLFHLYVQQAVFWLRR